MGGQGEEDTFQFLVSIGSGLIIYLEWVPDEPRHKHNATRMKRSRLLRGFTWFIAPIKDGVHGHDKNERTIIYMRFELILILQGAFVLLGR